VALILAQNITRMLFPLTLLLLAEYHRGVRQRVRFLSQMVVPKKQAPFHFLPFDIPKELHGTVPVLSSRGTEVYSTQVEEGPSLEADLWISGFSTCLLVPSTWTGSWDQTSILLDFLPPFPRPRSRVFLNRSACRSVNGRRESLVLTLFFLAGSAQVTPFIWRPLRFSCR